MMKINDDIVILKGSLMENLNWAKTLNELLGADNPSAKAQWERCNEITNEIKSLTDGIITR